MMKIREKYNKLVIIQVYAPTSKYTNEDIENLYCELQNAINWVSNRDILLVNGDLNCKVGGLHIKEQNVVGKHNNIERGYNNRGKTFIDFCKQNDLRIANAQFKHRLKYTKISPGEWVKNTIDFKCIRKRAMKFIKDAHVLSALDISDHRLVRCKMNLSFLCNKKYKNKILRFNTNLLSDCAVLDTYQRAIENNLPHLPNDDVEANEILHHIKWVRNPQTLTETG